MYPSGYILHELAQSLRKQKRATNDFRNSLKFKWAQLGLNQ